MNSTINNSKQIWILIRGLTRGTFHWFDFPNQLKQAFPNDLVITLEVPGNGALSHIAFPDSLKSCVEKLKSQLPPSTLKYNLIGISLGGMIVSQWSKMYPDEVDKLVLINSSFSISPFYHRLKIHNYGQIIKIMVNPTAEKIERFVLSTTCNNPIWKNRLSECIEFQKNHPIQIKNLIRQLLIANRAQFNSKPNSKCLILAGQKDRLVNYKCSLDIAAKWGLSAQIHPTAGHDLPLDAPEWIIEQIKNI